MLSYSVLQLHFILEKTSLSSRQLHLSYCVTCDQAKPVD